MKYASLAQCKRAMTEYRQRVKHTVAQARFDLISSKWLTSQAVDEMFACIGVLPGSKDRASTEAMLNPICDDVLKRRQPPTLAPLIEELQQHLSDNPDFSSTIQPPLLFAQEKQMTLTARHDIQPRELVLECGRRLIEAWTDEDPAPFVAAFEARAAAVVNDKYHLRLAGCRHDQA